MVPFMLLEALPHRISHKEYVQNFSYERSTHRPTEKKRAEEEMAFKACEVESSIEEEERALFLEWYEVHQDVHFWVSTLDERADHLRRGVLLSTRVP